MLKRDLLINTTAFDFEFPDDKPMGHIPQVSHTFSYVDAAYGVMNEHQLAIGESTCDAALGMRGVPIRFGGKALLGIATLSRIALQRCKTARCAIQTVGNLAVEYGFYGTNSHAIAPFPSQLQKKLMRPIKHEHPPSYQSGLPPTLCLQEETSQTGRRTLSRANGP